MGKVINSCHTVPLTHILVLNGNSNHKPEEPIIKLWNILLKKPFSFSSQQLHPQKSSYTTPSTHKKKTIGCFCSKKFLLNEICFIESSCFSFNISTWVVVLTYWVRGIQLGPIQLPLQYWKEVFQWVRIKKCFFLQSIISLK